MTQADIIAKALRPLAPGGKLGTADVPLINQLAALWSARLSGAAIVAAIVALPWLEAGLTKLGEKEVPGPKHNPWILSFWKQTPWLKTDDSDSPWCGGFIKWSVTPSGTTQSWWGNSSRIFSTAAGARRSVGRANSGTARSGQAISTAAMASWIPMNGTAPQ